MKFFRNYRKPIKIELFTSIGIIVATVSALLIYNSPFRIHYDSILNNFYIAKNISIHNFINDFLMSIFFLVAGLEIKHEVLYGNLCTLKKASFPIISSIGGVIFPALIYIAFNINTPFIHGFCIPISTDIAFAVGIFLIFSKRFNPSLKIFLLSLAVVDDLVSILAIGTIYSLNINIVYLLIGICILIILLIANKVFKVESCGYYLLSGLFLWYFINLSGIHSTISGLLLAIVIPSSGYNLKKSCLERLQEMLVPFNSLIIMPLFAFANTGISISYNLDIFNYNTLFYGIVCGLCIGKPLGIMSFAYIGSLLGIAEKPKGISWIGIFFVSLIAGIGFTMSIFVCEIAFSNNIALINLSKISILLSCMISILFSIIFISLYILLKKIIIIRSKDSLISKYYIN